MMTRKTSIWDRLNSREVLMVLFMIVPVVISILSYSLGTKEEWGGTYTHYNNFEIFRYSFFNLVDGADLYAHHPDQYGDLYKYSPAFALFMGIFAWMPALIGLILWNALNSLILFFAIDNLKIRGTKVKSAILWIALLELIVSLQNAQSNGLMAGLMIMGFNAYERHSYGRGSIFFILSGFIKIFGVVGLLIALFHGFRAIKKSAIYGGTAAILLAIIPIIVVSPDQLQFLYESWLDMLKADSSGSVGFSVMGILESWTGMSFNKSVVLGFGIIMLLIPAARIRLHAQYGFRLLYIAYIMIWVVIFNHKAESPTFVIAMTGIGIWYAMQRSTRLDDILLIIALLLTSVATTDLVPIDIRKEYLDPYAMKALPSVLIFIKIFFELVTGQFQTKKSVNSVRPSVH